MIPWMFYWAAKPATKIAAIFIAGALIIGWVKYDAVKQTVMRLRNNWYEQEIKRVGASVEAEATARRCALQPDCRLSDDGWRRN